MEAPERVKPQGGIVIKDKVALHYFYQLLDFCDLRHNFEDRATEARLTDQFRGQMRDLVNHGIFSSYRMLNALGYHKEAQQIINFDRERQHHERI